MKAFWKLFGSSIMQTLIIENTLVTYSIYFLLAQPDLGFTLELKIHPFFYLKRELCQMIFSAAPNELVLN